MKRIPNINRWRRMVFVFGVLGLWTMAAFIPSEVEGAVPQLINFQGILRDGSGNPVANGPYSGIFTIYDAPAGGSVHWAETTSVTTTSGLFTVLLGSLNPVPDTAFNNPNRWLGVKVGADPEMTPRNQLVSLGYAYRISSVDGASGGTITSKVSIGPGHINTGTDAFVAGSNNRARGNYSVVSGGGGATAADSNSARDWSVVGGGRANTASGDRATVGGGEGNRASGIAATVSGGLFNTASGILATVGGGSANTADGLTSFAAGHLANANHDGAFVWGDDTPAAFASTAPNQFLIRASGGVGIGTASPQGALHLLSPANPTIMRIQSSGTPGFGRMEFVSDPQGSAFEWRPGYIQSTDNGGFTGGLAFFVNGSGPLFGALEVMRLVNGQVGIGTTAPTQKLHVVGNICATGTIGACSDGRFKKSLKPIEGALDKIEHLRGVSYRWNREQYPEFAEGNQIGFVAQEVQEVLPEMVSEGSDGTLSVDYGRFSVVLLEAIKEQQKEIMELKAAIEKLQVERR